MARGRQKHKGRTSNRNHKFPDTIAEGIKGGKKAGQKEQGAAATLDLCSSCHIAEPWRRAEAA